MDDDQRDEAITAARISGTSSRDLAKQYGCSSREIEAAIDRRLDYELDNRQRLRLVKLSVGRIEALMSPFYEMAVKDKDVAAGTLCCKLEERLAMLLGLDAPLQSKVDVYQVQASSQPKSFDRIREAIYRVARGPDWHPNDGNGSPLDGDGAGGVLSPPGDDKPSH
jgi:hypothetical protein